MSAIQYEQDLPETEWEAEEPLPFPGGRRRRRWGRPAAALLALLTAATGFYAGVRVEKGQLSSSASAAGLPSAARTGTSGSGSSARGGFSGLGAFGGNTSIGTISSVDGNTIYITETSGNTVKVTLSSATKITKNLGVSKSSLHPGDSVVIQGATSSSGTIAATSVSDSGATSTGSTGSASSTAGTGTSAGSAVSSLFGSSSGG